MNRTSQEEGLRNTYLPFMSVGKRHQSVSVSQGEPDGVALVSGGGCAGSFDDDALGEGGGEGGWPLLFS